MPIVENLMIIGILNVALLLGSKCFQGIIDISVPGTRTFRYWLGHLGTRYWTFRYWPGYLGTRYWTVRDLDETIFGTDHNCLVLINCQYFCTSSSLIYDPKVDRYVFDNSDVDRCFCILIFIYIFIILTFASDYLISPMYESSSP